MPAISLFYISLLKLNHESDIAQDTNYIFIFRSRNRSIEIWYRDHTGRIKQMSDHAYLFLCHAQNLGVPGSFNLIIAPKKQYGRFTYEALLELLFAYICIYEYRYYNSAIPGHSIKTGNMFDFIALYCNWSADWSSARQIYQKSQFPVDT